MPFLFRHSIILHSKSSWLQGVREAGHGSWGGDARPFLITWRSPSCGVLAPLLCTSGSLHLCPTLALWSLISIYWGLWSTVCQLSPVHKSPPSFKIQPAHCLLLPQVSLVVLASEIISLPVFVYESPSVPVCPWESNWPLLHSDSASAMGPLTGLPEGRETESTNQVSSAQPLAFVSFSSRLEEGLVTVLVYQMFLRMPWLQEWLSLENIHVVGMLPGKTQILILAILLRARLMSVTSLFCASVSPLVGWVAPVC